jgi:hypothetical protein
MSPRSDTTRDEGDEEIACVRAVRHRISERFGHDPYRLVAYYMELQKQHEDRLVHAPEPDSVADGRSG